jgi:hypothetical protein
MAKGTNSGQPTTAELVGGVYNASEPNLVDGQGAALQLDENGNLKTTSSGGGGGNVNITGINSSPPATGNPLPVELSDGTNPVGTAGNPLSVNVITGGGSNASVGTTGTTAPTSATEIGIIDLSGHLQGASASNPVPTTNTSIGATGATAPTSATEMGIVDKNGNLQAASASNPVPVTVTNQTSSTLEITNSFGVAVPAQADANNNLLVGFNGPMMTVLEEILMEMRALRRLMFMVYEESGEGSPAQLVDDPTDPSQTDYN